MTIDNCLPNNQNRQMERHYTCPTALSKVGSQNQRYHTHIYTSAFTMHGSANHAIDSHIYTHTCIHTCSCFAFSDFDILLYTTYLDISCWASSAWFTTILITHIVTKLTPDLGHTVCSFMLRCARHFFRCV